MSGEIKPPTDQDLEVLTNQKGPLSRSGLLGQLDDLRKRGLSPSDILTGSSAGKTQIPVKDKGAPPSAGSSPGLKSPGEESVSSPTGGGDSSRRGRGGKKRGGRGNSSIGDERSSKTGKQIDALAAISRAGMVVDTPPDDIANSRTIEEVSNATSRVQDDVDDLRSELAQALMKIQVLEASHSTLISDLTYLSREMEIMKGNLFNISSESSVQPGPGREQGRDPGIVTAPGVSGAKGPSAGGADQSTAGGGNVPSNTSLGGSARFKRKNV